MSSLFDPDGRTVLPTGATRGIGRAAAGHVVRYGACVAASSRRQDACEGTAGTVVFPTSPAGASATDWCFAVDDGHTVQGA